MLNVLVIDDEKLVRQMVIRCIDWETIGFHIAGEASSARMGLEMVDELPPDLIFMDVRMPSMDGLTCSRMILKKYPQIKIIILSGHDEFEYASKAIHIGVFDYLLKPINAEELRKAAVKVRDTILEERDHQKEFERFKEELEKHSSYIRDRQLGALVRSRTPGQYLESLSYFGVELNNSVFQVALIETGHSAGAGEEEKLLMKMHIRKIVEDYYGDDPGVFVIDSGADWLILLNNSSAEAIYSRGEELKHYLENNTDARVYIGVGKVYPELEMLCESYQEAKDALKYRFVSEDEDVICFRDIYPFYDTESSLAMDNDILHELGNAVRISDGQKALENLEILMQHLKKTSGEWEQVMIFSVQLLSVIMKALSELKLDGKSKIPDYAAMIERVFRLNSFDEIKEYLKEIVQESCMAVGTEISDKKKDLVHKVRDYMEMHFSEEELALNSLAARFYVNPSYLSRVFKEKTGFTFSGLLFEIRMKEAEKLVLRTDLKAYEIAEQVGISDPHYFSACFKKFTGMSVSDYKKQSKNFNP